MIAARAALADLDALNPNELEALIVSPHELAKPDSNSVTSRNHLRFI
jgi:hypothetical protein